MSTKSEEHQKYTDTKLDQITLALEFLTTKLDNLTQDFVQKCRHSEKDKFNHTLTVSQNNDHPTFSNVVQATTSGLLPTPPGTLHIGISNTSTQ